MPINALQKLPKFAHLPFRKLPQLTLRVKLLLPLLVLSLTACSAASNSFLSAAKGLASSLEANIKLLPAYNNLPATIAGYKVLAVETAETMACLPAGTTIVVLQSTAPNIQGYLASTDPRQILQALKQIDSERHWLVEAVGPAVTFEQIAASNTRQNADDLISGCVTLGGGIPSSVTPTPNQ